MAHETYYKEDVLNVVMAMVGAELDALGLATEVVEQIAGPGVQISLTPEQVVAIYRRGCMAALRAISDAFDLGGAALKMEQEHQNLAAGLEGAPRLSRSQEAGALPRLDLVEFLGRRDEAQR